MSPLPGLYDREYHKAPRDIAKPSDPQGLVLEAWAEGFMVGSLIIMTCITIANMRRRVLLHKLILIELVFGYWQGFFILFNDPIYAWWLSIAAIPLNMSWVLHNVIAWMKLRPFLHKKVSAFFIGTVILSVPYWILEIYANFTYFHNVNKIFLRTRPWEALCRDPWWIAATIFLVYNIKTKYDLTPMQIIRISPRFAVMLAAMLLSILFIVLDVLSVTDAFSSVLPVGINPFWKLSFVFKCLTDSLVLDDFKTALDRLRAFKISRLGSFALDGTDRRSRDHREAVVNANSWAEPPPSAAGRPLPLGNLPAMPSPDGDYIQPRWKDADSSSDHLEHRHAEVVQLPSRDRDDEISGIQVIDHARRFQPADHSHPLRRQRTGDRPSSRSSSPDIEYAMAVREMSKTSK